MKKVLLFTALAAALTASFAQANEKLVVAWSSRTMTFSAGSIFVAVLLMMV